MHPDIEAFWLKDYYKTSIYPNSNNYLDKHMVCISNGAYMRPIYDKKKKLYWFYPTFTGNPGKWYSEKEMLKILKLKAFL